MTNYDTIIVGGGLGGLSAARAISENSDISILIIDGGKSRKNNPTRLTFRDTIENHGLSGAILKSYRQLAIRTINGFESCHDFGSDFLVALDYFRACEILETELMTRKNIKILRGRAYKLVQHPHEIQLTINDDQVCSCQVLIDATGKKHFVLTQLGHPRPALYSHSYGLLFDNCHHPREDRCHFIAASKAFGSGGGWYYPLNSTRASVGFAVVNNQVRFPAADLMHRFNNGIKNFLPFSDYLKGAKPIKNESGTIPIEHTEQLVHDRILLVGDSAGQATPWMCMGVEPVVTAGEMAGDVVRTAIEKQDYSMNLLGKYQQQWDSKFKKAYDEIKQQKVKIWFLEDEGWDFLISHDVSRLSPSKMIQRMKSNAHLKPKLVVLCKWIIFKFFKKLGGKY